MKSLTGLLLTGLLILICGCAPTTTGISDKNNRSMEPIMMHYSGTRAECINKLNRRLVETGFQVNQRDTLLGIIDTAPKSLLSDESYKPAFGVTTSNQSGRVSFVVDQKDSNCEIAMRTFISVTGLMGDEPLPQGHPLPMKLKKLISELPGFVLDGVK